MNSKLFKLTIALFIATSLGASAAIFLKIEGIDGESKTEIKVNRIEMAARSGGTGGSGMATGKRRHKVFTVTKPVDQSTPLLAKALKSQKPLKNLEVNNNGHVTVLKVAYIISITKDRKGNEVIVFSDTKAQDYNSSRSNRRGISDELDDDSDDDEIPANHNTTRSNRYAP